MSGKKHSWSLIRTALLILFNIKPLKYAPLFWRMSVRTSRNRLCEHNASHLTHFVLCSVEYLQHREARGLIEEVKVLCVEWRWQDRRTWIIGPRLKSHAGVSSMQRVKSGRKKGDSHGNERCATERRKKDLEEMQTKDGQDEIHTII